MQAPAVPDLGGAANNGRIGSRVFSDEAPERLDGTILQIRDSASTTPATALHRSPRAEPAEQEPPGRQSHDTCAAR